MVVEGSQAGAQARWRDLQGRLLGPETQLSSGGKLVIPPLAAGMYLLEVKQAGFWQRLPVVVQ